ncbi:type IV pilus modification PilV family protein [Chitinibacter tainanensis]|uniref:type IV pilus modification PilV family protein n=1 Tax=Chitinibacter tainanensis TaxID=230667 RepID=UPI0003FFFAFF|nr:prepilin-type N-terminal cleavage/methylation domain-containing protein [Chitinibacter tainanensis]
MNPNNLPTRQTGFSMIEVLITLIVISGSILALTSLQTALQRETTYSAERTEALDIANNELNRLNVVTFANITNDFVDTGGSGLTFCPTSATRTSNSTSYTVTCSVSRRNSVTGAVSGSGDIKLVTVTAAWRPIAAKKDGSGNYLNESVQVSAVFSE